MEDEVTAITCTCKVCGRAFVREVSEKFWTKTPSKRWKCEECGGKTRKRKRKD